MCSLRAQITKLTTYALAGMTLSLFPASIQASVAPSISLKPTLLAEKQGISTPVRVTSDPYGYLYVADPRSGGIAKYDRNGKLAGKITTIPNPRAIAISTAGDIIVSRGTTVTRIAADGSPKADFTGTFTFASGIVVADSANRIFVTDSGANCVKIFDLNGTFISEFGTQGSGQGQFLQPSGIAWDRVGNQLAVVDTLNCRIQFFELNGTFKKSLGSYGSGALRFTSPRSVAFEYSSDYRSTTRMYVVDSFQSHVQVIDPNTGTFLSFVGNYGITAGSLLVPSDTLFDSFDSANKRLVVANGFGNVTIFGIDGGSAAPQTSGSGPLLTINAFPLATNLTSLSIGGTVKPNGPAAVAGVTVNGVAASLAGSNWSSSVTLSTGVNVVTVIARDVAGAVSTQNVTINVIPTSGTTPPVPLVVNALPSITNVPLQTISGSAPAGASITINGGTAITVPIGGAWSQTVTLGEGLNNFMIVAQNAGNSDTATSVDITLDTIPPVIGIAGIPNGSVVTRPIQTISGFVSDTNATTVTVTVNGTDLTVPVVNGLFNTVASLNPGINTIAVVAADQAGNTTGVNSRTITLDPGSPSLGINTPTGTTVTSPSYTVSGNAPVGTTVVVAVNRFDRNSGALIPVTSSNATLSGATWSATLPMSSGLNQIVATVTDPKTGQTATAGTTVVYSSGIAPTIAITSPARDTGTINGNMYFTGTVGTDTTLTATVNGVPTTVTTNIDGTFTVNAQFPVPGTYNIAVTAMDSNGTAATSIRSVVYDPIPPKITVVSQNPLQLSYSGGTPYVIDQSGRYLASTIKTNGIIDLTGIAAPETLNIYILSKAEVSTRNGDINMDGKVDIADALKAIRIALGLDPFDKKFEQMLHADVGPVVGHTPTPDGRITLSDVIAIIEQVIGLPW
ncbi:6-bladed beta-propeller [Geobacter argillaceus]|uniref:6-phosphogluconolactonase (Cycloisomerase 2 family) n=1 Tax=Geobacter argillaceus TaxID=345631 RepID=A0A562VKU6_9BACT|nr:6-bladed beta-propeller [Geobacter argillaceus]TWJ18411.1 6-phosphogluconolactonase (cycloisomerase 2 family) [Geobacter argillaceus]